MIISDEIYGDVDISDEVLLEIMRSAPLQRLKGVSQLGVPRDTKSDLFTPGRYYTRYEHSVGVMLLLRLLGASLEEQAAGLIHDVSHTAFSHVIDWVLGNPLKEDYQDSMLKEHIKGSALNGILSGYGFDVDAISRMEHNGRYALLESAAPDLCADRVDYALRDGQHVFGISARDCLDDLLVHGGEIMFRSRGRAALFGRSYMKCQDELWGCNEAKLRYYLLSALLKSALGKGILGLADLYKGEDEILRALLESNDAEIARAVDVATGMLNFSVVESGGMVLVKKLRYVDPKFLDNGLVRRLSEVDEGYRKCIADEKERSGTPIRVKIIGDGAGHA